MLLVLLLGLGAVWLWCFVAGIVVVCVFSSVAGMNVIML